jgi:hypothetical protein
VDERRWEVVRPAAGVAGQPPRQAVKQDSGWHLD